MAVAIELGGQMRRLALDLNATIALMERSGQDVFTLAMKLKEEDVSLAEKLRSLRLIVWASLITEHPEFEADATASIAQVGSWLSIADVPRLSEAVGDLIGHHVESMKAHLGNREFGEQLGPYVPTPHSVVAVMVEMAGLQPGETVLDLGAGDGRLLFAAAKTEGVTALGYELHMQRFNDLRKAVREHKAADRIALYHEDLHAADLSQVDVIFLYMLPKANEELAPKMLAQCNPGCRVIAHDFSMPGWEPVEKRKVASEQKSHVVYKYVIPERADAASTVGVD